MAEEDGGGDGYEGGDAGGGGCAAAPGADPATWAPWKRAGTGFIFIVRSASEDDPSHGCAPNARPLEDHLSRGVVALDKPAGPTSHQVTAWARDILGLEKAGHGGTLDPRVTGVLPVALESSTRVVDVLLESPKEYVAVAMLHRAVRESDVLEVFSEFMGEIYQVPPVRSAVKRRLRTREIYELEVLEVKGNLVLLRVLCEAGTYIRTLVADAGEVLGCGAQLRELRRVRSGPFTEDNCVTLHRLRDAAEALRARGDEGPLRECVQPVESLLGSLPVVHLQPSAVDAVCHGATLAVPGVVDAESSVARGRLVCLRTLKDEAVAVGRCLMGAREMADAKSGDAVRPARVIMEPGTYPRMWKSR